MAREAAPERAARLARLETALAQLDARLHQLEQRSVERSSALEERLGRLECSLTRVLYCSAPPPASAPRQRRHVGGASGDEGSRLSNLRKAMGSTQFSPINVLWLTKEISRTKSIGETSTDGEQGKRAKISEIYGTGSAARRSSAQLRRAAMRSEARELDLERYLGLATSPSPHLPDASHRDAEKGEDLALLAVAPCHHAHGTEVLLC